MSVTHTTTSGLCAQPAGETMILISTTHLTVKVGERTDDLAYANEEEWGECGGEQEAVQRRDHVVLDL